MDSIAMHRAQSEPWWDHPSCYEGPCAECGEPTGLVVCIDCLKVAAEAEKAQVAR